MTWLGLGRPKGHLPNTSAALERLRALLTPHRELVGDSDAELEPVDWSVGCSDQGDESSCTGHGNEKLVYGTAKANGYAGDRGDEHGIYALRAEDYPELALTEPLPDGGAMPATIAAGLPRFGVLAAGDGPRGVGDRLDFAQLERANGFRVTRIAHLDLEGNELVAALLRALARGCASFVMQVTQSYEDLSDGQVYSVPSGPVLGGHCQGIDAWRRGANGVEIGVPGSWGPQFGRVWIPASLFGAIATNVYVGQVVPKITAIARGSPVRALVAVGAIALLVAACQPTAGGPPPVIDATAADPACVAHCAHAAAIGCPEGASSSCAPACTAAEGSVIGRVVDWGCVDRASDVAGARACGVRFCGGP